MIDSDIMDRAAYDLARYHKRMAAMKHHLGGQCAHCMSVSNLQIDHIDAAQKSFEIATHWWRPWDVLLAELTKCQLLCKQCHVKKSRSEGSFTKNKARGERVNHAKLTASAVRLIRSAHQDGATETELAERFGVTRRNINMVVKRETWKHVI